MVILLFMFSFWLYAFGQEPINHVRQYHRASTLYNVRTTLANSFTPRQRESVARMITNSIMGVMCGTVARILTYCLMHGSTDNSVVNSTHIENEYCYVDLDNMCVDACNNLKNTCYLTY